MVLRIELSDEQESLLRDMARREGVPVEDLARQALMDLASRVDDQTLSANAKASVEENDELLRQLS